MPQKTKPKVRTRKEVKPFDLSTVDPGGRVDVLAANFIDRIAEFKIPELKPFLTEYKGVIHSTLNHYVGPHVINPEIGMRIKPLVPLASLLIARLKGAYDA